MSCEVGGVMPEALRGIFTSRRTLVPLVLVLVLLFAVAMRWHVTASISNERGMVIRWVQDRWTGETWIRTYLPNEVQERPGSVPDESTSNPFLAADAERKKVQAERDRLTTGYYVALGAAVVWLLMALTAKPVAKPEPTEPNEETPLG